MEIDRIIDGRFEIVRFLGKGSMSQVWLANDGVRRVALKFADSDDGPAAQHRANVRLASEAQVLARLDHPNVPHLVAVNLMGPRPYLAMEYVDGIRLEQEIGRRARTNEWFPAEDLLRLVQEIAATLAYAHSLHVVHRDLKPANVMLLDRAGRLYPKVLDFGVAKMLDEDPREATTVGRIVGTPLYLSPEQVFASGRIGPRADVFALGVLVFEMLVLRRAWLRDEDHLPLPAWRPILKGGRNTKEQVLDRITAGPRPNAGELRPELPEEVDAVLARALAIDPEARPATPMDLARELADALLGRSIEKNDGVPKRAKPTKPMIPSA